MQFNWKPQLVMSATNNEIGAWLREDKEGEIFNLSGPWGKSQCQWKNPLNCQLPFLSHSPNHLIFQEIGWSSYFMGMGRVWGLNSNLGKPIFGEKRFWLFGQVNTKNACPFGHTTTFSIWSYQSSLRHLEGKYNIFQEVWKIDILFSKYIFSLNGFLYYNTNN